MQPYVVTYLWWRFSGQSRRVIANSPLAAAEKAFRSGYGYCWAEGEERHCLQESGMECDAAAKVINESTGEITWVHLYEYG